MDSTHETPKGRDMITVYVNREIYTLSGLYVGTVHDVRLDFDSLEISHLAVAAEDINPDAYAIQSGKDGVLIPYRWVRAVGDVIIINDVGPREQAERTAKATQPADD